MVQTLRNNNENTDRTHPVPLLPHLIDNGLLPQAGSLLKPHLGKRAAIIANETVAPLYLGTLQTALDAAGVSHLSIILPDGEAHKNRQTLNLIFDGLI